MLDLGIGGVGPWAASQLAQMGACVLKVEAPNEFILQVLPTWRGLTTTYACLNVAKHSARLNLKDPTDRERAWTLIDGADVIIENFRAGAMERLGFGFDAVTARNRRVVYCSSSGFGSRGPMAGLACTDPHMQAFSGFASLNGVATGERVRYYAAIDLYTSALIVDAVLAGLLDRDRTGLPQRIEMTMLGAATTLTLTQCAELFAGGPPPRPLGARGRHSAPDGVFRAADGDLALGAENNDEFAALCSALDRPDLMADRRFSDQRSRLDSAQELFDEIQQTLARLPVDWWLAALSRAGVRCARVHADHETVAHRDTWAAGHVRELVVKDVGTLVSAGVPWEFQGMPSAVARAPRPGQDTELVASEPARAWSLLEALD
ncbi:MAG: CoA transferase [Candidatus Dormibacteraeota bacterium]|uniref:CoA transferase n=1 Tax=Candidatus Dormiibacter inghamiae TaxID=3127013 RepID=A0A934KFU7_9BACT|nr:CoA transferase [Candidatus Dormibacteraeota bacterium]